MIYNVLLFVFFIRLITITSARGTEDIFQRPVETFAVANQITIASWSTDANKNVLKKGGILLKV